MRGLEGPAPGYAGGRDPAAPVAKAKRAEEMIIWAGNRRVRFILNLVVVLKQIIMSYY